MRSPLERNELGALLVAVRLGTPAENAPDLVITRRAARSSPSRSHVPEGAEVSVDWLHLADIPEVLLCEARDEDLAPLQEPDTTKPVDAQPLLATWTDQLDRAVGRIMAGR